MRKAGFNYLSVVARQWQKLRAQNFHTLYNNFLPLKLPSNQADKKQVPAILGSFFTKVSSQMIVSGELNNGRAAGGGGGKGAHKKCQTKKSS